MVCPSPIVTTASGGAKGSNSRNRQTPLKSSGLRRLPQRASNSRSDCGDGNAVPFVADVEQAATGVTGDADLVDGVVPAAVRAMKTAGKLGKVGFSGNQEIP